ncbi:MAG: hypothetical protein Q8R44_20170 [Novosphingobium sp.]|nr:hypothetical protein [Novosphingobium sp.]
MLGNVDDQRFAASGSGKHCDFQLESQSDWTLSPSCGAFGQQLLQRDRIAEAETFDFPVFPNLFDLMALAARQLDGVVRVGRQRMKCPDLQTIARNIADHHEEFALTRNKLGGADEKGESRRLTLLPGRGTFVPTDLRRNFA